MSLLRNIQDAAVDNNADLPTILRKCKILATRLGNEQFKQWVEHELNGYKSIDELPDYRVITANSYGSFANIAWRLNRAPIPISCLPEKYHEQLRHSYMMSPISSYASLIEDGKKGKGELVEPWPPEIAALHGGKIYVEMQCLNAWKEIPRNVVVGVLDTVRNRILSFVLEIETEAPDAGEAPPNSPPIAQERVTNIYNTYIAGSAQNVAAGGSGFSQAAQINVRKNDLQSLAEYLSSQGIELADIEELKNTLTHESTKTEGNPFGGKVGEWITTMLGKAANGAWKVTTDVASTVLTKALSQYLGLPT